MAERFSVNYCITPRDGRSIEEHARDITFEQTVEVPPEVVPDEHFELEMDSVQLADENAVATLSACVAVCRDEGVKLSDRSISVRRISMFPTR